MGLNSLHFPHFLVKIPFDLEVPYIWGTSPLVQMLRRLLSSIHFRLCFICLNHKQAIERFCIDVVVCFNS